MVQPYTGYGRKITNTFMKPTVQRMKFCRCEISHNATRGRKRKSQKVVFGRKSIVETAILLFDIDFGPCCNERHYSTALNDYCQQPTDLPSREPPSSMSRGQSFEGLPSLYCIHA
ncbi:hypothetical protein EVAR_85358_1 [Eumeta japonica]|uniref:Uncharacterized protein n=1 Tax=Eumeta variegata TaxID=151549 RepID=A0A4C1WVG3_EUMVA|nr:hypothetical protein EVAR_85358_1 [Eumeta japonica]